MADDDTGVVVPASDDGRRSSSVLGRAVMADALRAADPSWAADAEGETDWRRKYLVHFRRAVVAGVASRQAALTVASDGLRALHSRVQYRDSAGLERPLDARLPDATGPAPTTVEIHGTAEPETEFSLPVRGERLSGAALARQLDSWATAGLLEPSAADQIRAVMANPEWLRLDGQTVVVLGAEAEMGPLQSLLRWGARIAAIDLPRPDVWRRVLGTGRESAGTLLVPVDARRPGAEGAGLDLSSDIAAAAEWIGGLDGRLVLGNYVYADGVANLRLSAAVDALAVHLQGERPELALAFLATPTDVFAVPADAVAQAARSYAQRSPAAKLLGPPLRMVSAGRLLRGQYGDESPPGIHDALVAQQGPNYALAKRVQRWRAIIARDGGSTVSMNIAPPTRTRSVLKNRALAAAYAGAHHFGVEVFEPSTANTLMAGLLVADLHNGGGPAHEHPWEDEAHAAVHGGLWRAPYEPRSALGLAAVIGYRAARR